MYTLRMTYGMSGLSEDQVRPNTSFQRTQNSAAVWAAELGPFAALRAANGTGVDERPDAGASRQRTGRSSGPSLPRLARKRAPARQLGRSTPVPLGE